VKRRINIVILAVLLIGSVLLGLNDTNIAVADTSAYDNETTSSVIKASNSSAGATITITMTGILD